MFIAPWIGYGIVVLWGWYAYKMDLTGTDGYAWYLAAPLLLLTFLTVWFKRRELKEMIRWRDRDFLAPLIIGVVCFFIVSLPYIMQTSQATAMSYANNDIADTDSIASFLKEFNRTSTEGFLGQRPVFKDLADSIIFGGPYSIAFAATVLKLETFPLQNVSLHVFYIFGVFILYSFLREVFVYRPLPAAAVTLLFGTSPVLYYTQYQTFQAQIIGMGLSIVLYLLFFFGMREKNPWSIRLSYIPLLVLMNWGIAYTYPHMLIIVCVLQAGVLLLAAVTGQERAGVVRGVVLLGLGTGIMLALYPPRAQELASMFWQRGQVEAGWFISWLFPDFLLGFTFKHPDLVPGGGWKRVLISAGLLWLLASGMLHTFGKDRRLFWLAICLLGMILGGYALLAFAGRTDKGWGGYKSYKFVTFFLPILLAVFYLRFREFDWRAQGYRHRLLAAIGVCIIIINTYSAFRVVRMMQKTHKTVSGEMADLKKIRQEPRVSSINILGADWWAILWETDILMNKRLYFETSTYCGRSASALEGEWDLIRLMPGNKELAALPESDSVIRVNTGYLLRKHPQARSRPEDLKAED
ncbi:hypothetical protein JW933_06870 [candidate division FCPU426 bacterium]|nr:hypothetical protein [candidate division FCPU426 bacterium]